MPELKLENSLVDDRYEVRERLGLGSYAEIWVARDHQQGGQEVVLKTLNTSLQGTPDSELERTLVENFQNEAIALDTVRHPHVILRLGHGTAADLRGVPFHYLVLEYMPGGDLLQFARKQPCNQLALEQALHYFQQVCEALAYAHSHGIIHRDLKPNNFLLSADHQTLKVADFGVAKLGAHDNAEITRVGAGIYAPPEHHPSELAALKHDDGDGRVERLTAAADVYSLAKSFYTIVCGRAPSQFACAQITALPTECQEMPWADALLRVLKRATATAPAARYASIIEFWSELANVAITAPAAQHAQTNGQRDEETQVRPRLANLTPNSFDVPTSPEQPAFNPVLASSGQLGTAPESGAVQQAHKFHATNGTMTGEPPPTAQHAQNLGAASPASSGDFSGRKIVVGLPDAPAPRTPSLPPVLPAAVTAEAAARSGAQEGIASTTAAHPSLRQTPVPTASTRAQTPVSTAPAQGASTQGALTRGIEQLFTGNVRRRLFVAFLFLGFFGLLLGTYRYVRSTGLPVGAGKPSQLEVLSENLNVRAAPTQRAMVLGVVAKGTQHRVTGGDEETWVQIEVSQWNDSVFPHVIGKTSGWVYLPNNAKITARRWN